MGTLTGTFMCFLQMKLHTVQGQHGGQGPWLGEEGSEWSASLSAPGTTSSLPDPLWMRAAGSCQIRQLKFVTAFTQI